MDNIVILMIDLELV